MYYTKHLTDKRVKRCRRTVVAVTLLLTFLAINAGLRPIIETMLINQARAHFNTIVNRAVERTVCDISCDSYIILTENAEGAVTSAQADTEAINLFRARLGQTLAEELGRLETDPICVPLGTLTGIDILTGRGPEIRLRLVQSGSVTTEIVSAFASSGINQTCHTIDCIVEGQFYAVIPGFSAPVTLQAGVVVAQSVIVGDVPDSYTVVNGDQSDTIGRIFDYGDPYGDNVSD